MLETNPSQSSFPFTITPLFSICLIAWSTLTVLPFERACGIGKLFSGTLFSSSIFVHKIKDILASCYTFLEIKMNFCIARKNFSTFSLVSNTLLLKATQLLAYISTSAAVYLWIGVWADWNIFCCCCECSECRCNCSAASSLSPNSEVCLHEEMIRRAFQHSVFQVAFFCKAGRL